MYTQKGGKYIAEGSFGCVFNPYIKASSDTDYKDAIGKIFTGRYEAEEEVEINSLIKRFDPNFEFTVPFLDEFTLYVKDVKNQDPDHFKCTKLKNRNDYSKLYQLVYKNGGDDLTNKNLFSGGFTFEKIFDKFLPVLEGVKRMQHFRLVHADIKPHNMLFDKRNSKLSLIDFGLMIMYPEVYDSKANLSLYNHKYPFYPPEFRMEATRLQYKGISERDFAIKTIEGFRENIKYYTSIINLLDLNPSKEIYDYIVKHFKGSSSNIGKELQKNVDKIDIYSLGVTLLYILSVAISENKIGNIDLISMKTFIKNMMHFNVDKRYNIDQAIAAYKKIIESRKPLVRVKKQVQVPKEVRVQVLKNSEEFKNKNKIYSNKLFDLNCADVVEKQKNLEEKVDKIVKKQQEKKKTKVQEKKPVQQECVEMKKEIKTKIDKVVSNKEKNIKLDNQTVKKFNDFCDSMNRNELIKLSKILEIPFPRIKTRENLCSLIKQTIKNRELGMDVKFIIKKNIIKTTNDEINKMRKCIDKMNKKVLPAKLEFDIKKRIDKFQQELK